MWICESCIRFPFWIHSVYSGSSCDLWEPRGHKGSTFDHFWWASCNKTHICMIVSNVYKVKAHMAIECKRNYVFFFSPWGFIVSPKVGSALHIKCSVTGRPNDPLTATQSFQYVGRKSYNTPASLLCQSEFRTISFLNFIGIRSWQTERGSLNFIGLY